MKKYNRSGRFEATLEVAMAEEFPDILYKLKFVPTEVNYDFARRRFEYIGLSPQFAEVPEGGECRTYTITIKSKNGKIDKVIAE